MATRVKKNEIEQNLDQVLGSVRAMPDTALEGSSCVRSHMQRSQNQGARQPATADHGKR